MCTAQTCFCSGCFRFFVLNIFIVIPSFLFPCASFSPLSSLSNPLCLFIYFLFLQTINLCSSSPCLFPSLRKSYQAACQIIRWDICLKTHLQKGIIPAQRHNFNQTRQQNVFKICQTDIKRKTEDREREQQRGSNKFWTPKIFANHGGYDCRNLHHLTYLPR